MTTVQHLDARKQVLFHHPVFNALTHQDQLRELMQWHVFAVWDFMTLAKRLQNELTCTRLPWVPPRYPDAAHLINEIVTGEETDRNRTGGHSSHFELYVKAMEEVHADVAPIERFISEVREGQDPIGVMRAMDTPPAVIDFVGNTLDVAMNAPVHVVAAYFLHGREDIIPEMFSRLLSAWQVDNEDVPTFVYYLKRHIELDADNHGPAAEKMLAELVGDDVDMQQQAMQAAIDAVDSRIAFWDALLAQLTPAA
ncbi:DUF3050 domain-containing protein [Larsenimonas rhizosphaerae]|uniref:DUF3050 domain-containing protein n=1 Tax=Larsenimonas rhizosphaerae TaxID=2944682 RepID=A0AA41ZHH5_9GAMM|nr:DUF3050 domain-containing protein [Larsenimonas rhizosphaerae]MCM2129576.1 DUF3050 domain-containing protein [Larsenimonas rhizosphaerae]MCX2524234.1 DUF3050 domain-containing protein [Larsenimonas rhizosphaerae]